MKNSVLRRSQTLRIKFASTAVRDLFEFCSLPALTFEPTLNTGVGVLSLTVKKFLEVATEERQMHRFRLLARQRYPRNNGLRWKIDQSSDFQASPGACIEH